MLFRYELAQTTGIVRRLRLFNLTGENNFATWWSGILLLLTGLHSSYGYVLYHRQHPRAARGWAFLAIIMLTLSADETSSLHERADQ